MPRRSRRPAGAASSAPRWTLTNPSHDELAIRFPAAAWLLPLLLIQPVSAQTCDAEFIEVGAPRGVGSLSDDGRFVSFYSGLGLDPGDTNGFEDVYVRDRSSGLTLLVSRTPTGAAGNGPTRREHALSPGGRFVAFISEADDLVVGDTNGFGDVFLHDLTSRQTTLVSRSTGGAQGLISPEECDVSGDGRYVAFSTLSGGMVPGDTNGVVDVFVRDTWLGTTERVSVGHLGQQAAGGGIQPDLSADGRYVAFTSGSADLVAVDTNNAADVFVRDRALGTTLLVSISSTGVQGSSASSWPSLSGDGRQVTFQSTATELAPGIGQAFTDIFVHDLVGGRTRRVTIAFGGGDSNFNSAVPVFSTSGRYVTFQSLASNLVPGDDSSNDIFVRDLLTDTTRLASRNAAGQSSGTHATPSPSSHADEVVYWGFQSNLDASAPVGSINTYLTECDTSAARRYCRAQVNSLGCRPGIDTSGTPTASGSGSFVISAEGLLNQQTALLFYGKQGPASSPFRGATRCVQPPLRRTPTTSTGGNGGPADCSGTLSFDFDAWVLSGRDASLVAGQQVHAQFYSRDPSATRGSNLTDAVAFTLAP